jgi:hypothetical protein
MLGVTVIGVETLASFTTTLRILRLKLDLKGRELAWQIEKKGSKDPMEVNRPR